ncbi:sensor histidine kinase [Halalkalibacter alkalisediminis]|uniref:histidine kinase n=1 Tax=Halalkalibacter alkalisediminis TaxID=935616 RepID=A0ABV6NEF8_9BACI|nr:sensor histidine kinase [Halalkalibacter alkalisediminis]
MIKIRTKLLIYFVTLLFITITVTFSLYQNNRNTVNAYDENFRRFLLLNEITQTTNAIYEKLTLYIIEDSPDLLLDYKKNVEKLHSLQAQLEPLKQDSNNSIQIKNYENMLTSLLEQSERTLLSFELGSVELYYVNLFETERISTYIHETTLSLINEELTDYHQFYEKMVEKQRLTNYMGVAILIASLIVSSLFAVWFSTGITKSISKLNTAANEISRGNFNGKAVQVSSKDELWFLAKTFNDMRGNIRQLVEEIKENSKLNQALREMELRSLQNQINPHFLFNTLNAILKTSYLEGAERTGNLISSVSTLLRYNLGNLDKTMMLEEEVKIVKEYFYIQKTRFGDRVSFKVNCQDVDMDFPIPCLTLQPIVENAFVHGIEEMEEGAHISLNIYMQDEHLIVDICDNGIGMDEKTRKSLLTDENKESPSIEKKTGHSTGIGLKNVRRRLEIFYQNNDVMDIRSGIGEGTVIRLKLPIHFKGEKQC